MRCPFIIGVAGGTASGKSTVCSRIIDRLALNGGQKRVVAISQDCFYRDLVNHDEFLRALRGDFNFDHPDAFEHSSMLQTLKNLKQYKPAQIPLYDFKTHSRIGWRDLDAADVILVEGILIFFDQELRSMFDLKLFVDTDPDIRLARRVERDTTEWGRPLNSILHQYLTLVKPAFEDFCLPTKKYADVIIPRGAENNVAIELIVQHIQDILRMPSPTNRSKSREIDENGIENDFKNTEK
ncbi:unnamed protein product [Meloidogyne enterolobii]|uniref:Uncharacterized protein n=1 Tax=Meloidogyne enterolobii TaxID=390850 RepID=A0ACB0Z0C7_MELEN